MNAMYKSEGRSPTKLVIKKLCDCYFFEQLLKTWCNEDYTITRRKASESIDLWKIKCISGNYRATRIAYDHCLSFRRAIRRVMIKGFKSDIAKNVSVNMKNAIVCLQEACDKRGDHPAYDFNVNIDILSTHTVSCKTNLGIITAKARTKRYAKLIVAAKSLFRVMKS